MSCHNGTASLAPRRLLSMLKSRMNIKALFVVILLGLVVVLLPQNYLGQSLAHEIGAIQNNTYSPLSLNFLRLWHPPRARKPKEKQATTFNSEAPPCEKTLLYRFAGAHGFASEFLIFLRVFLLARYFGFEVIIDDSSWNYGRWTDYFAPLQASCSMPFEPRYEDRTPLAPFPDDPPLAFLKADNMRPLWTRSSHVIWSARKLGYVDELLLSLYTDAGDVDSLHEEDQTSRRTALPLNASQTLPAAYRQAFDVMGGALSRVWALNEEMTSLVNSAAAQMASSPAKDSPLIGAHVRLGDKALELHKFSSSALPSPRQSLQDLYNHWVEHQALANSPSFRTRKRSPDRGVTTRHPESPGRGSVRRRDIAHLSVHQYAKRSVPHELYIDAAWKIETEIRRSRSEAKSSVVQPTLLVLSDDSSGFGLSDLLDHAAASKIRVFVGVDDLLAGKESALNGGEMEGEAAKSLKHSQATVSGFHEATFNAMPLKTRVENTKSFLRDLTVTARFADGLVFTGSSNVGRLLALLSAQGRNGKRLFYSADVRWFPTTRYL